MTFRADKQVNATQWRLLVWQQTDMYREQIIKGSRGKLVLSSEAT